MVSGDWKGRTHTGLVGSVLHVLQLLRSFFATSVQAEVAVSGAVTFVVQRSKLSEFQWIPAAKSGDGPTLVEKHEPGTVKCLIARGIVA
jgi:hypothetical protein